MALATENRIDELLREEFTRRRVADQLHAVELFVTPEGVLAEVVLRDASFLEEAQKAVQDVAHKLGSEGVSLLPTVRALWQVKEVQRIAIPSPPGVPSDMVAGLLKGTLESGRRCQEVWVAVTPAALGVLRPLVTSEQAISDLVLKFLEHRLSIGGGGHWDPIRDPRQELDVEAARYLRWRPYEQLKRLVDLVFSSIDMARSFLHLLNITGKGAHDFNHVLAELPGPGGAIAPGERVPRSNDELYEMLLASEKADLRQYYFQKLERACEDWPSLEQEFPSVLAA